MIDVQNRTPLPGKEGRVTFALDGGTTLGGILSMADEATQEGTPWDRDTARKLQADIRTYPVAAGQSITAGDVVDVVGGAVTKAGVPSQAIALTTAAAGTNCEVIYSGVASIPGIAAGQKIASDGVYGVGVLSGVLQVWSKERPGQIVTGSYVGTGTYGASNQCVLTFNTTPKLIEIGSNVTSVRIAILRPGQNFGLTAYGSNGYPLSVSTAGNTISYFSISNESNQMNTLGQLYYFTAFM